MICPGLILLPLPSTTFSFTTYQLPHVGGIFSNPAIIHLKVNSVAKSDHVRCFVAAHYAEKKIKNEQNLRNMEKRLGFTEESTILVPTAGTSGISHHCCFIFYILQIQYANIMEGIWLILVCILFFASYTRNSLPIRHQFFGGAYK